MNCNIDNGISHRLFAAIATVLFVTASWGCDPTPYNEDPCLEDEDTWEIIVAAEDIDRGTTLTEDKTSTVEIPRRFSPGAPLLATDLEIYTGEEVYFDLSAGEMILTRHFHDYCAEIDAPAQ